MTDEQKTDIVVKEIFSLNKRATNDLLVLRRTPQSLLWNFSRQELKKVLLYLETEDILERCSEPTTLKKYGINPNDAETTLIKLNKKKFGPWYNAYTDNQAPAQEIQYNITFSMNNEIIINNLVLLSQPNFGSENAEVFEYVIERPNKEIKQKEIEKHIGRSIGKDLHKIVENLGFKGDVRKAFFRVSTDTILLRNPVTRAHLAELGIPFLRISPK